jgi:hypothetical protein
MSLQVERVADEPQVAPTPSARRLRPVAHILHRIKESRVKESHPLRAYISAFNGFEPLGECFVGAGSDSVAIKLATGAVLKISTRDLPEDAGTRPFDLPILERGRRFTRNGLAVSYFIQPEAGTDVDEKELWPFADRVAHYGYEFHDFGLRQLCYFNGDVRLLDPFAVMKAAELQAIRSKYLASI